MILTDFHWVFDILQGIDVGVVVMDLDYRIELWNGFMVDHSGMSADEVIDKNLLALFPEIDRAWFNRKASHVVALGVAAFTVWEQRAHLIRFGSYQPITGHSEYMYQNTTLLPVKNASGRITHLCLILYDVTHEAVSKQRLQALQHGQVRGE